MNLDVFADVRNEKEKMKMLAMMQQAKADLEEAQKNAKKGRKQQ